MVSKGQSRGSQIHGAEEEVDCEQMKTASAADSTRSLASAKDVFQGFSVSPNSQTASNFPHDFLLQPQESPRFTQLCVEIGNQGIVKKVDARGHLGQLTCFLK